MTLVWQLLISGGILAASEVVARGRTDLQQTTLRTAWGWAVAALAAWISTWIADQCLKVASPPLADHAWYACAVMALCPPMAVLGSRRPGTRVWMWFILFPMLLALVWPLIAVRLQGSELRGIQLELPQFCAFTLILVMGVGNYLGTRFTISALLYAAAVLPSVVSLSSIAPSWLEDRSHVRLWCSGLMAIAIVSIRLSRRPVPSTRINRLWFDFFDTFGIVWGRRIQDRVNHLADKESWPFRLELEGFVEVSPDNSASHNGETGTPKREVADKRPDLLVGTQRPSITTVEFDCRVEHTLRWLLRRFVDPPWINRRLGSMTSTSVDGEIIDS